MENNVAYNIEPEVIAVENYYEPPRRPLPNLPVEANANQQDYRRIKISAAIAISALVSALLSLLVAIIALSVSKHLADLAHTSCTCNSNSNSTLSEESRQSIESYVQDEINTLIGYINTRLDQTSSRSSDQGNLQSVSSLEHKMNSLQNQLYQKLSVATFVDTLNRKIGTYGNPVHACSDLPQESLSGGYWIQSNTTMSTYVYCDMERANCGCNTKRGWMRVAYLDMTDSTQQCPEGFKLVNRLTPPLRICKKIVPVGCWSTTFPTHGVEYSHVCGRIKAYQDGAPDAFASYQFYLNSTTIDDNYVDGISLTHGQSPRTHIWTFAAAIDEYPRLETHSTCPCTQAYQDSPLMEPVPPFVGEDYFCDTGSRNVYQSIFYPDDPLWDGQGCGGTSTCCEFNNPPWFCKQLSQQTTDDIELRSCTNQGTSDEDTPLEIVEIYVQ